MTYSVKGNRFHPDTFAFGGILQGQRIGYRGRKKSLNSEQIAELKRRVAAGDQKTLVARDFGISRETLYQYLRED
ncbi:Hin recombinase [Escherichia coli]|nr:Hin recombinase [Escherichia coli]